MNIEHLERLISRGERLMERVENLLPRAAGEADLAAHMAFRWRRRLGNGHLEPVEHPHRMRLNDLRCIDRQKAELDRNTRQFLAGLPANNALLWGARGTGKSSLIKALLNEYADRGLRLVEVDKDDLIDLSDIVVRLRDRTERILLYCDDLSFESSEPGYKALKAALDGSISATPENVLLYATSNRRHLIPEYMSENRDSRIVDGELHHGEAVEEKISLSERFGLWLSFHPFSQRDYLEVVAHWLEELGHSGEMGEETRAEALRFALTRGSRSGRVAWQFACHWVGSRGVQ